MNNDGRHMKRILLSVIIATVGICAWCENIPDAVTVQQLADDDFSYLLEGEGVVFTFDGDNVNLTVDGVDETGFTLSETAAITICPAHTFKLTANQDPDNPDYYYSTFFTSDGAYKVPEDEGISATAFAGTVESGKDTDVLRLTDIGNIIHKGEAVILRASQSDITLMPSCNKADASAPNILEGTDEATTLSANQYALSLGQNGVGFYSWSGRAIGANKAYLTLPDGQRAPLHSLGMIFYDGTVTGIPATTVSGGPQDDIIYNLQGLRVDGSYKGVVIKNGQKVYNY